MVNKCFYIFDFEVLKTYISEHNKELRTIGTYDGSRGYALPLAAVIHIARVVSF